MFDLSALEDALQLSISLFRLYIYLSIKTNDLSFISWLGFPLVALDGHPIKLQIWDTIAETRMFG